MIVTICKSCMKKAVLDDDDLPNEFAEEMIAHLAAEFASSNGNGEGGGDNPAFELREAHCLNVCHARQITLAIGEDLEDGAHKFTVSVNSSAQEISASLIQRSKTKA